MILKNETDRTFLKNCRRIVIKVGTSSLLYDNGKVNLHFVDQLARQIADLKNQDKDVILVTSGAIGVGFPLLGFKKKPHLIPEKQASAAVGQQVLMNLYEHLFHNYSIRIGQLLFTKGDEINSRHYLNMKNSLQALLELDVLPIINENDAVSVDEIKIGDNDTLSAIVASIANADLLIILSDIDGLYSADPRKDSSARLIHEVPKLTREYFSIAGGAGSKVGTGGMYTKIQAAQICTNSGIPMIIAKSSIPNIIEKLISGEEIGTLFKALNVHPELKKKDIIIGTAVKGTIFVDAGCKDAILHHGSSLLSVGIVGTDGKFSEGDVVSICFGKTEIARGITHFGNNDINLIKGCRTNEMKNALGYEAPYNTVVHRDYLWVIQ